MGKFTKLRSDTFDTLQLDAGVLLHNFDPASAAEPADEDIVCATTGGITISCVPTYSDMGADVDNAPANTMELKKLDGWACKVAFNALDTSLEMLKLALGAADIEDGKVVPRRDLKPSDFSKKWWVGDKANGGMVAVAIMNALSTSGLSLKSSKNGKGQLTVELTGHVSLEDQDVMPMEFWSTDGEA